MSGRITEPFPLQRISDPTAPDVSNREMNQAANLNPDSRLFIWIWKSLSAWFGEGYFLILLYGSLADAGEHRLHSARDRQCKSELDQIGQNERNDTP